MKSFSVENIKSFKNKTEIELKPLTILVGRNSCGKSSLIRFPVVLSQTCDDDSQSPLQLYGKLIDYGTFNDVVFGHQGNDISFTLKYDVVINNSLISRGKRSSKITPDVRCVEITTHLGMEKERLIVSKQQISIDGKCVFESFANENNRTYKVYSSYDSGKREFSDVNYTITCSRSAETSFLCLPPNKDVLRESIKQQYFPKSDININDERKRFYAEDMLFAETDDEEILKFRKMLRANMAMSLVAGPIGIPMGALIMKKEKEKFKKYIEEKIGSESTEDELRFWMINDCFSFFYELIDSVNLMFRNEMSMLSYIGPFRQSPERIYRDTGSHQKKVGVKGENASNVLIDDYYKNKALIDNISDWLFKALGYRLVVTNVADGYFQLLLEDKNGIRSNISDVGYGISQILPIVTQALVSVPSEDFFSKNNTLSEISIIEQPELHLHPAAQAELAELFVACVSENKNRNLLIETHSEHFIRKLQVLIADPNCKISNEDVAVFYIDKDDSGAATLDELRILPNGKFEKRWPTGFFDKAHELSMALLKASIN